MVFSILPGIQISKYITFYNKTLTIAKQHWHRSIKEHITGLGAITFKKIINLK